MEEAVNRVLGHEVCNVEESELNFSGILGDGIHGKWNFREPACISVWI
jgi:hypothetical protein